MFREALLDAWSLVLPVECAGCGADDRALCGACSALLRPEPTARRLMDGTAVVSGLDYEGVVRSVIVAYKHGRTGLARHLAPALVEAVRRALTMTGAGVELCAIPSTRTARRRRGFDPVPLLLARSGLRATPVFVPARPHAAQKTLGVAERAGNLEGVFRLRGPVAGRRFLLVDDVVTTGSTLATAAAVLRSGGAEAVAAAVIASTPRRRGDSSATLR